jgi:hypothetical protein
MQPDRRFVEQIEAEDHEHCGETGNEDTARCCAAGRDDLFEDGEEPHAALSNALGTVSFGAGEIIVFVLLPALGR